MLTFMNSKLPDKLAVLTSNITIYKSKSYGISSTDIYIGEDLEFIIHVYYSCIFMCRIYYSLLFTGVSHLTIKYILNAKNI